MSEMFAAPPKEERKFPTAAVSIAAVAVAILVAVVVLMGRRDGRKTFDATQPQPAAAYANHLEISGINLSESTNMSGAKITYVDGHIANTGSQTVTGITVQATFPNDAGSAPERKVEPLQIIRAREPEVDTVPVSMAPIAPGGGADFRLIFEGLGESWNMQPPTLVAIAVGTK